jgi:hypothetical protein
MAVTTSAARSFRRLVDEREIDRARLRAVFQFAAHEEAHVEEPLRGGTKCFKQQRQAS